MHKKNQRAESEAELGFLKMSSESTMSGQKNKNNVREKFQVEDIKHNHKNNYLWKTVEQRGGDNGRKLNP